LKFNLYVEVKIMAAVTGPISSLPGASHIVPQGQTCDCHPGENRPATHRIQGETDSFGSEMIDMCDEGYASHIAEVKAAREANTFGYCDICKLNHAPDIRKFRDPEEGTCGPVYDACRICRKKINDHFLEGEDEVYDDRDFDWDPPGADERDALEDLED